MVNSTVCSYSYDRWFFWSRIHVDVPMGRGSDFGLNFSQNREFKKIQLDVNAYHRVWVWFRNRTMDWRVKWDEITDQVLKPNSGIDRSWSDARRSKTHKYPKLLIHDNFYWNRGFLRINWIVTKSNLILNRCQRSKNIPRWHFNDNQ